MLYKQAWDSFLIGFNKRPYEFGTTFIEPKSLPTINQALDRGKAMSINTPVVTWTRSQNHFLSCVQWNVSSRIKQQN